MRSPPDPELTAVLAPWRFPRPVRSRGPRRGTNNWMRVVDLPDHRVVVRVYRNLDPSRVAAEHRLLRLLAGARLPFAVPEPIPLPDGRTWAATPYGPAAVFGWITGTRPRPTPASLLRVGEALGRLDRALAHEVPAEAAPYDWRAPLAATHPAAGKLPALVADLRAELGAAGAAGSLLAELHRLDAVYADLLDRAPVQVVHQDMALSNAVLQGGRVVGLLDFELAGLDLRVSDVVATLIATGCLDPADDRLVRARALLAGYSKAVSLTPVEVTALPDLLRRRAAGALVWRYGRYRLGQASRHEVVDRLGGFARDRALATGPRGRAGRARR